MERIQQDPRLTANRSKSVNSSIAEAEMLRGYVGAWYSRIVNQMVTPIPGNIARNLQGRNRDCRDFKGRLTLSRASQDARRIRDAARPGATCRTIQ